MSILIPNPPPQFCRPFIMGILQMGRYRKVPHIFHRFRRFSDCHHRRIAFWRTCHIGNCLCQNNLRLRHSHPLHGEGGANRHLKGCRIRIPHVFRCANHNTPCNKRNTFPRIQHPCQIVNRRIRVRPSHALDKSRYGVVVAVPSFVVPYHTLLDTFLCHFQGEMYLAVFAALCGHYPQFHRIQGMSGIPARQICQKVQRIFIYNCLISAHSPVIVG